jgi:hypothetical protein
VGYFITMSIATLHSTEWYYGKWIRKDLEGGGHGLIACKD